MRGIGTGEFIVLAWGGLLGGFAFLYFTDFALTEAAWCDSGDNHCFRDWVGALSGWAAALAAGITIAVLLRQAQISQASLHNQRRLEIMREIDGLRALRDYAEECRTAAENVIRNGRARMWDGPKWEGSLYQAAEPSAPYSARLEGEFLRRAVAQYELEIVPMGRFRMLISDENAIRLARRVLAAVHRTQRRCERERRSRDQSFNRLSD